MKIGLLIIDLQYVHLEEESVEKSLLNKACMHINYVSELLRSQGHVIVHIQDIEGMNDSNQASYDIIPDIQIKDGDLKLTKEIPNAFWQTELEDMLRSRGVELLIIAGFAAEHCVLFTFNGARERGFKSVILQDGIVSAKQDVITSTYRDRNLISYPVVEALVQLR